MKKKDKGNYKIDNKSFFKKEKYDDKKESIASGFIFRYTEMKIGMVFEKTDTGFEYLKPETRTGIQEPDNNKQKVRALIHE